MDLTNNTLPQLYNKLDLHLANIQNARIVAIPSRTNEFAFFDERARALYILDQARKLNSVAQEIDNKLRFAL